MASTTTPDDLERVRAFLNTVDYEDGVEQLGSPEALRSWLLAQGWISRRDEVTAADLRVALALRGALREALVAHHEGGEGDRAALERLDDVLAQLPVRLSCCEGGLVPCGEGVPGALAGLAAAVATAQIEGTWDRLKVCPADDCAWVFYDSSRNRSRRWCSMEVCGNRSKVRAFRDRADA